MKLHFISIYHIFFEIETYNPTYKYIENSARKREKNIINSMNVSVAVCNSVEDERRKLRPREEQEKKGGGGKKRQGRRRLGRYTIWVSASVVGSDAVRC